jgi:hypothetical protein
LVKTTYTESAEIARLGDLMWFALAYLLPENYKAYCWKITTKYDDGGTRMCPGGGCLMAPINPFVLFSVIATGIQSTLSYR